MKNIEQILKTSGIIRVSPSDTLASALGKLKSSHDAAFVFDKTNKFLGIVNPYYALIKTSAYDGSTKVENALFHPPHIKNNDALSRIVKLMNESKVHYLPVFDEKDEFIGITSARRILAYMKKMDVSKLRFNQIQHTQKGKVITVTPNEPVLRALQLFKEYKTSKIVAVDKYGKLKGILSHYDLIPYIMAPGSRTPMDRSKETHGFKENHLGNYIKSTVLAMRQEDSVKNAIDQILAKEIGSIILIDHESKPVGIVTTRDILDLLRDDKKLKKIQITVTNLSKKNKVMFDGFVKYISQYVQRNEAISEALISYKSEKNDGIFKIFVHLLPFKGEPMVISREGKDLSRMFKEIKDIVRR